jgi:DNA-binding protein YbaB
MTDPDQILSQYEGKLAEAQRKSEAIKENLANLRVTERSADGQITVTVNDAGNLVDLKLGTSLQRRDGDTVGQEVLRVVQAAQSRVATAVQEAMSPVLGGDDSEAMQFMGAGQPRLGAIEDEAPPPPPPRPQRPRSPQDDDGDFSDEGFLR